MTFYYSINNMRIAEELTRNNEIEIVEMRRFVKTNNSRDITCSKASNWNSLPGYMKADMVHQSKIQSFVDRFNGPGSFPPLLYPRGMEAFAYRSSSKLNKDKSKINSMVTNCPLPLFFS
ncbi:hypothetical protein AVEN_105375-1 [Araneus ventricosus]|uniref:Uncharacterized protein n=1 Tax=Araneus ventricosus TaxID=182803 RepID=A0A4Y2U333_ARAVE|nr:hypothetical protein AVEN_105375-1 [Araneus ventricosus]